MCMPVHVPVALLLIQIPVKAPGKSVEDGLSPLVPTVHVEGSLG